MKTKYFYYVYFVTEVIQNMNKTVELVNQWATFEERYPDGSLDDFCRFYLARQKRQSSKGKMVGGVVPPFNDGLLLKIMGRISKLNMGYAGKALHETGISQLEEFGMLVTILQEVNPRKTDIIYSNLLELSSGTDMLNRMKKNGLIQEYEDAHDKRSKRIELTAKGKKVTERCYEQVTRNARMLMQSLSDDDKQLCVYILKEVEIKLSALWPSHKGKSFDDVYKELTGSKS
jgi:DNA-binding MarR family transcriptional regulator